MGLNDRVAIKKAKIDSAISILGHARKTHSLQHLLTLAKEQNNGIYLQLPKTHRQPAHI
jgi:hypothetical protein